jgi:PAS domain S-box-containing protein
MDERDLIEAVTRSPLPMVASNPRRPDNPLEFVNAAFCHLTGYSAQEVLGRNCRFLAGVGTHKASSRRIGDAIRTATPVLVEIVNYRSDGTAFRNGVTISPLFGVGGSVDWFLGSQVDLGPHAESGLATLRTAAEERVGKLPRRRRQVLALMARGLLNKQIAWELRISEKTVKMHRALLIEQLRVATSAEAIRLAMEAGL